MSAGSLLHILGWMALGAVICCGVMIAVLKDRPGSRGEPRERREPARHAAPSMWASFSPHPRFPGMAGASVPVVPVRQAPPSDITNCAAVRSTALDSGSSGIQVFTALR